MKIGIIGAGFVGLTFAAVLASKKHDVILVDSDTEKIQKLNLSQIPFYEPKLDSLFTKFKNSISLTSDVSDLVQNCQIIFITVGTPSLSTGGIDLTSVKLVIKKLSDLVNSSKKQPLIVLKSTVIPGTHEKISLQIDNSKSDLELISNPEFLREGKAVEDTLYPHIVVIGGNNKNSMNNLKRFYHDLYGKNIPIVITNPQTAEMIKYANNSFLATKISFINQLANICQNIPGVNIDDVAKAIGVDPRIGSLFLNSGPGYGGSCLPKDLDALILLCKKIGQNSHLLKAVKQTNENQVKSILSLIKKIMGTTENKKITILGLSFKEDSDDIRESVSLKLIHSLLQNNAKITAHDPMAIPKTRELFRDKINFSESIPDALKNSECVVIMTAWKDYRKLSKNDFTQMKKSVIIDTRRILVDKKLDANYHALGLGI